MIIGAVTTFLWGCSDEPEPKTVTNPQWQLDLVENESTPEWKAPESGVYQFSMTAIIRLSDFLEKYADSGDQVSAFIGDECRGVATVQNNGNKLFFLYIRGDQSEEEKVTLKYYSAKNKKTYVCEDLLVFEQNGIYGSLSEPAIPPFEDSGKYPASMTAVAACSLAVDRSSADIFAAFVGNECRGVGELTAGGDNIYEIEIRGKENETSTVTFLYYSAQNSVIYQATETITFKDGSTQGTTDYPISLKFKLVTE